MISLSHAFSDAAVLQRRWPDTSAPNHTYNRSDRLVTHSYIVTKEEVRNMRTFGGELGEGPDEVGLCGKMQEMFDSMEWMNT